MSSSMHALVLLFCSFGFSAARVAARSADSAAKQWWETTHVYQIWPRSFQDSNGDGEGDLKGIINRLDYIKNLGAETIWLNPIYSSPLVDGGYDVANHTDVNPLFGTLEDFDNLIREAHRRDLKIILDIIPNHSSDQHKWFQLSARNVAPYRDYYVWADGNMSDGKRVPPNDWVSIYSDEKGSAWTWHEGRRQWYYHKFHETQPDLNLRNENVKQEILEIFNFWLRRNVDGFRINSVSYFYEDSRLHHESSKRNKARTIGRPENIDLLYQFRSHVDKWVEKNRARSKLLIAESHDPDDHLVMYYGNDTHTGVPPYNMRFITHINNKSDADFIRSTLTEWLELVPDNKSTNWVLSNHDHSRATSRIGLQHIDGFYMLNLLLPGQAFTYYGEEIAMVDAPIPPNRMIDPMFCVTTKGTCKNFSRDPARAPMQWNSGISAGFSTNKTTYLPVHNDYTERNVEAQQREERSHLKTYKTIAALRKEPVFTRGNYELATLNDNRIVVLKRFLEDYPVHIVIINLASSAERVNLTSLYPNLGESLSIVATSVNAVNVDGSVSRDSFIVMEHAALVLRSQDEAENTTETTTEKLTTVSVTSGKYSAETSNEGETDETSEERESISSASEEKIESTTTEIEGKESTTPMPESSHASTEEKSETNLTDEGSSSAKEETSSTEEDEESNESTSPKINEHLPVYSPKPDVAGYSPQPETTTVTESPVAAAIETSNERSTTTTSVNPVATVSTAVPDCAKKDVKSSAGSMISPQSVTCAGLAVISLFRL